MAKPIKPVSSTHLTSLRTIARLFDDLVPIPGTKMRFGLDAILGLLPGGGDLIGGAVSAYAILLATRVGAPASVIARMGLNIAIDTLFGILPVLGDLFDVGWKANRKNVELLEQYVATPGEVKRSSVVVVAVTLLVLVLLLVGVGMVSVWLISRILSALH